MIISSYTKFDGYSTNNRLIIEVRNTNIFGYQNTLSGKGFLKTTSIVLSLKNKCLDSHGTCNL